RQPHAGPARGQVLPERDRGDEETGVTGFIETPRFPDEIAFWNSGGRGFLTTVVETWGGQEFRNSPWTTARGVYTWTTNSAEALRSAHDTSPYAMAAMRNLYRVTRARLYAFRFKD